MRHEHVFGVDEEDEVRRTYPSLNQVVYLQGVVVILWKALEFFKFVKPIVEQASRYPSIPLVVGDDDTVHHFLKSSPHLGTDKHQRISMQFPKVLFQLLRQVILSLVAKRILDGFPLIDSNNNWPSLLDDLLYQRKIINDEGRKGIH